MEEERNLLYSFKRPSKDVMSEMASSQPLFDEENEELKQKISKLSFENTQYEKILEGKSE